MTEYKQVLDEFKAQLPEGHAVESFTLHPDGLGVDVTAVIKTPLDVLGLTMRLGHTKAIGTLIKVNNSAMWSIRFDPDEVVDAQLTENARANIIHGLGLTEDQVGDHPLHEHEKQELAEHYKPLQHMAEKYKMDNLASITVRTKDGATTAVVSDFHITESRKLTPVYEDVGQETPSSFHASPVTFQVVGTLLCRTEAQEESCEKNKS